MLLKRLLNVVILHGSNYCLAAEFVSVTVWVISSIFAKTDKQTANICSWWLFVDNLTFAPKNHCLAVIVSLFRPICNDLLQYTANPHTKQENFAFLLVNRNLFWPWEVLTEKLSFVCCFYLLVGIKQNWTFLSIVQIGLSKSCSLKR